MTGKRGIRSEQEGWIAVKWLRRYATRKMGETFLSLRQTNIYG